MLSHHRSHLVWGLQEVDPDEQVGPPQRTAPVLPDPTSLGREGAEALAAREALGIGLHPEVHTSPRTAPISSTLLDCSVCGAMKYKWEFIPDQGGDDVRLGRFPGLSAGGQPPAEST